MGADPAGVAIAALDYPNAPTVGQQYVAPNGVTYQWDGAAWVVTGGVPVAPSGPAGGSLAGTYPNPSVAASAIRGTPSSGGTAREISKASIWAGDDLIDLSISTAKIAKGNALFGAGGTYSDTSNLIIPGTNTEIKELSVPVDIGRPVLLLLRVMMQVNKASTAGILGSSVTMQTYIGGTTGTANGTLQSSEAFVHALPTQNVAYSANYSYFALYTPAATPLLWKAFGANADPTNYTITKTGMSMVIVPFA